MRETQQHAAGRVLAKAYGNIVIYSGKCCTGEKPPPEVPQADYDEFVEIVSGAV